MACGLRAGCRSRRWPAASVIATCGDESDAAGTLRWLSARSSSGPRHVGRVAVPSERTNAAAPRRTVTAKHASQAPNVGPVGVEPRPIDYESTTAERCAHLRICRSGLSETRTVICSLNCAAQRLPGAGFGCRGRRASTSAGVRIATTQSARSGPWPPTWCRASTRQMSAPPAVHNLTWQHRQGRHTMCYVAWMSPPDPRYATAFEWDSSNEEHLAQHDVLPYEVDRCSATILSAAATNVGAPLST